MPRPVIHDNDGHVDDLLSTLMLWLSPEVELQAVTITDGDCYVQQAFEALVKMAMYLDLEGAEIGFSEEPMINQFPENWRRESYIVNELPLFGENTLKKPYQSSPARKSQALVADCLAHSREPVTFVTTGPLTNVSGVFNEHPELKSKVKEFVVMGGAINAPGNVEHPDHDGSAEWNFFADPQAAKSVLDTGIPIKLIPLDVTNKVPISRDFLDRLDNQSGTYRASNLAAKVCSLVKGLNYFFWDTLTAAAVLQPELFSFKDMRLDISTQGANQGRTSTVFFGGRKCKVATDVQRDEFENLVLSIFRLK